MGLCGKENGGKILSLPPLISFEEWLDTSVIDKGFGTALQLSYLLFEHKSKFLDFEIRKNSLRM